MKRTRGRFLASAFRLVWMPGSTYLAHAASRDRSQGYGSGPIHDHGRDLGRG
ncbi:hypothetical protein [Mycobacterium kyorinense]|uniref:hypothetical protein n=1 Tax=Mycobacterium kyorinense TaxID=487514 RepID=UPI0012E3B2DD|nr:hypothetical protein [Mycobacterium kyorinense]